MINEIPITISYNSTTIFSILRTKSGSEGLLILVPAETGTRIGPQRIFVEIARSIAAVGVDSLCVELPPYGESIELSNLKFVNIESRYYYYLNIILSYIKRKYSYKDIILLSISYGCMPILDFARINNLFGAILLSPNYPFSNKNLLNNTGNHVNCNKLSLLNKRTKFSKSCIKGLSIIKKLSLILHKVLYSMTIFQNEYSDRKKSENINILCIIGGKNNSLDFIHKYYCLNLVKTYNEIYIPNSDHSFFGWDFKRQVNSIILKWITNANIF